MNLIHRTFASDSPVIRVRLAAERIYMKVQTLGTRQVRFHQGMLLTYPYPARRGYGTRGRLVGVYSIATRLEWIEGDVMQAISSEVSHA